MYAYNGHTFFVLVRLYDVNAVKLWWWILVRERWNYFIIIMQIETCRIDKIRLPYICFFSNFNSELRQYNRRCVYFMTYQDIFKDAHLLLPKSIPKTKTYRSFLYELFDKYLELLNSVSPKNFKIVGLSTPTKITNIAKIQKEFISGLKKSIEIYLDGQPAKAYNEFSKIIEYRTEKYKRILNVGKLDIGETFYRIRTKEENFAYSSLEMFHIPFELRGKVSTQRYSIPGFPSLYLGKTLYVSWEELKRPRLDNFQAVMLKSIKPIQFLDLTPIDWGEDNLNNTAYKYLMTWPLIAACSIKVKDPSDTFKLEYIIPQLLLQWIRENKELDGIKYNSTNIETGLLKSNGDFYNLVLPVKDNKDEGYCTDLINTFEMTETISWQLLEYAIGGQTFIGDGGQAVNKKIPEIEIIKGRKYPYSYSALGKMELYLDGMPTKRIE